MLSGEEIETFVRDGFVRIGGAVPPEVAARCRAELWQATGCDPDDPATWTRPVVRIPGLSSAPFREAANTAVLHEAFDQLVGPQRWHRPQGLGTFPVRFPSPEPPGDDGWHLDAGYTDPMTLRSHGRALLMLFLFSDVGDQDAPTLLRTGSHRDVPQLLAQGGLNWLDLCGAAVPASGNRPVVSATGQAGDVFLCHPFLIHSAQPHRGTTPRFMAQPPLEPAAELDPDAASPTPVERAVQQALAQQG